MVSRSRTATAVPPFTPSHRLVYASRRPSGDQAGSPPVSTRRRTAAPAASSSQMPSARATAMRAGPATGTGSTGAPVAGGDDGDEEGADGDGDPAGRTGRSSPPVDAGAAASGTAWPRGEASCAPTTVSLSDAGSDRRLPESTP